MKWITKNTTPSEVVNHSGSSITETIKAVKYLMELRAKLLKEKVIEIVKEDSLSKNEKIEKIEKL